MPAQSTPRRFTRGLRFRIAASYAIFFTLAAAGVGVFFRQTLALILEAQSREALQQDWAALKTYLQIDKDRRGRLQTVWFFDRDDPDESSMVGRLRRVYFLADARGRVIEGSELYRSLGIESPEEIRNLVEKPAPVWRVRTNPQGMPFLIRAGLVYDQKHKVRYYAALGRSLAENRRILEQFTWRYLFITPMVILGACVSGWFLSGRALRPVKHVARAAQRISGSNLSLRIPARGAGDELDYLITTFNRMIERLESSFEQVRRFSIDASHELRTPITAIRGQLEVALFTAQEPEQYREAILNALQDIERLSDTVGAMLHLSQAESGQVVLDRSRVDLCVLLRDIVEQFGIPAEMARVRLKAELPPECEANVDRLQIERMLSNLLSNALKFTPPGGLVTVKLSCDAQQVRLTVEDTGCGIAPEHLPHIFERFYRAPAPQRAGAEKGLGLGLSFVAWIVSAHGGDIGVESVPGSRTSFRIVLPSALEPETAGASTAMNEV